MAAFRYYDAQLYDRDLELFPSNAWLNDAAINFYFETIYHEQCNSLPNLLLMDPAVVSCMMLQCDDDDDLEDLVQGLKLRERDVIVLPINDRRSFDSQGSHWALLVYNSSTGFKYYDSSSNQNLDSALEVASVLQRAVNLPSNQVDVIPCPQQENAFDCGMYVCLIAEWVCSSWINGQTSTLKEFVTPLRIQEKRKSMPAYVKQLRKKSQC